MERRQFLQLSAIGATLLRMLKAGVIVSDYAALMVEDALENPFDHLWQVA
jgi:hypothetical protein